MQKVQTRVSAHFQQIHVFKVVQSVMVAVALVEITRLSIKYARTRNEYAQMRNSIKNKITLLENQGAALVYSVLSIYLFSGMTATFLTKQSGQNPRIDLLLPVEDNQTVLARIPHQARVNPLREINTRSLAQASSLGEQHIITRLDLSDPSAISGFAERMDLFAPFNRRAGQVPQIAIDRCIHGALKDHDQVFPLVRLKKQGSRRKLSILSANQMLDALRMSHQRIMGALRDGDVWFLKQDIFLGGTQITIQIDLKDSRAVSQYLVAHDRLVRVLKIPKQERETLASIAPPQQLTTVPRRQLVDSRYDKRNRFEQEDSFCSFRQLRHGLENDMLSSSLSDSLGPPGQMDLVSLELLQSIFQPSEEVNPSDFVLVNRPCLPEIGVFNEHLFGENGILMRLMLFRSLLDEYNHLLEEEEIDLTDHHGSQELRLVLDYLTNPASSSDAKEQYERFVDAHEALMLAKEKSEEVAQVCRSIARVRMTPRIQAFQEDFVKQHINSHDQVTLQNFSQIFVKRNKAIAAADPQMKVACSACNWIKLYGAMSWSHYMKINPPQLRNIEDGVYYLRHATPNKYDSTKGVIIDPLYREFLQGADGRVLYAAHQRLQDDGFPENEDVRCQTLVQLEQEEENLMLLFQSVENTLFKKGTKTFEELITKLIDSFYQAEGHRLNRLPLRLRNEGEYREKMREICNFIHQRFFRSRVDVNQDRFDFYGGLPEDKKTTEWQMFIMLFYYYQRENLKAEYPIKYVNTGCKDDFDRGGGQNITTDLMHLFELHGKEIPAENLQAIMDSVQAPTLQLKGTEPIKNRIHPALCIAELLFSLQEEDILAIQVRGRVQSVVTEKRDHQSAIFLPKLAQTIGEYKAILNSLSGRSYTIHSAEMIRDNCTMSREQIISQLERDDKNRLTMDGHLCNEVVGWWELWNSSPYTIEQIYEKLRETHQLSEEAAVRIMNQLKSQIYAKPLSELKKNLEVGELELKEVSGVQSQISLDTEGKEFVISGQIRYEIVDMSEDGARVAILGVNVTLRIPKTEGQRESGEWSWRVNQII